MKPQYLRSSLQISCWLEVHRIYWSSALVKGRQQTRQLHISTKDCHRLLSHPVHLLATQHIFLKVAHKPLRGFTKQAWVTTHDGPPQTLRPHYRMLRIFPHPDYSVFQHDGFLWSNLVLQKRMGIKLRESGGNLNRLTPLGWGCERTAGITIFLRIAQKCWEVTIAQNTILLVLSFWRKRIGQNPQSSVKLMQIRAQQAFPP